MTWLPQPTATTLKLLPGSCGSQSRADRAAGNDSITLTVPGLLLFFYLSSPFSLPSPSLLPPFSLPSPPFCLPSPSSPPCLAPTPTPSFISLFRSFNVTHYTYLQQRSSPHSISTIPSGEYFFSPCADAPLRSSHNIFWDFLVWKYQTTSDNNAL